jgi:thioredoxin 1
MSRPAVFSTSSYLDALAASKASGGLLLVDATASWCQPCQVMDRVTWADLDMIAWITANAVAVQIDVDQEKEVARFLGIRSMPTVVAFRAGAEVDRVVGLKRPRELISWLMGLQRGETNLDRVRAAARANPGDMQARYALARTLAQTRRFEEATDEYIWLWQHVTEHEPAMVGVRGSYMLGEIGRLVQDHPPARTRFVALRDALGSSAPATTTGDAVSDWIALTLTLGEEERVLAWFDSNRELLGEHPELEWVLRRRLVPLLTERNRWADVSGIFRDPLALLRKTYADLQDATTHDVPPEVADRRGQFVEMLEGSFRKDAALIAASLLAAKREDEARIVLDEARRLLPGESTERVLRETATKAGVTLPS